MNTIEYKEMYAKINATVRLYEKEKTIHQLFEDQVERNTSAIAVKYREESITYGELNYRANAIAVKLREAGVQTNTIVGLMVNRSIDMIVGMIGILKAGGCYLPIDSKFPKSRIQYMLEDSRTEFLLTQHSIEQVEEYQGKTFYFEEEAERKSIENIENINSSRDLAYVIYTSGSTGKPKGVMLEHQNVHNFILGVEDLIEFNPSKTLVSLTTISFDIFVLESLLPLTLGMKIVIADPMNFIQDLQNESVQMLQTTPSTMQLLLNDERNYKHLDSVTDIMLGGEAFPPRLLAQLKCMTKAKIYNMYGPTETTVWSTIKELTNADDITIGYPIANTQIYIVDESYNILPFGEEGEICIAGDGVARGYLDRPQLTAERFIQNKLFPEVRMYRTGDLGKILINGEIEFLGRIDSQVKIRGFRIELGEIESALLKVQDVKDCVVVAKENKNSEKYLVGYYIADKYLDVSYIIECLKETLPDYMIPGFYLKIDEIPLTPNGKINRLALPDLEFKRSSIGLLSQYIEPSTDNEKKIVELWKLIFNLDEIGIEDDFFYLGGNSILLSKLHVELEKIYNTKINIAELFANRTVKQQCKLFEKSEKKMLHAQLQTVCFPPDFYVYGADALFISEILYTVDSEKCNNLEKIAKLSNISLESVFLTLYMFVLAQYTKQNEIMVLYSKEELSEYLIIQQNTSESSDLVELCKEVFNKENNCAETIGKDDLGRIIFEDKNEVISSFIWNSHSKEIFSCSNEICMQLEKTESGVEIVFLYNENRINRNEIVKVFDDYVKFIELVTEEVE